jgi:short-subunit dehydrogenase
MKIDGATVMVTGASGGLGQAIARELSRRGAKLVLTARNEELLAELSLATGGEAVVADLADRRDLDRLCERFEGIDVLVANAGIGADAPIEDVTIEQIDAVIEVNLRAPVVMATRFAQRALADGRPGQIVMMGSLSGMAPTPDTRMYNAPKFGLRGLTLALRQDLADTRVGVTLVAPGFIDTAGMFAENDVELPSFVRTKSPSDVAAGVVRAIEHNPTEVYVAPVELRAGATFATVAPGLSAAVQRLVGTADTAGGR